jgi:hypothetical protein
MTGGTVSTKRADKQDKDQETDKSQWRVAAIGVHVLRVLGQPDQLRQVDVRSLWPGHYRVNVLVGVDAASVKVAHSYFLTADVDGNVLQSVPEITKRY